ncbi:endonuclease/exonuclease/phosphatase family protein [Marinactinospora rubrisoli]|uniref:Endonuclease/exonuclease/phosphatase family protein n=1 Tax=Marinactinospora rubrisoli TaxID=2715399 RepID=A0ABW2KIY8_9ACTN
MLGTAVTLILAGGAVLVPGGAAAADEPGVVISEVYGGGGNSGATWRNDFVELGNAGAAAVGVDGWSVQYLPAQPGSGTRVQVTELSGEIAAGGRYLVQEGAGSGGSRDLPVADAEGGIAMAAGQGTVLLVAGTEPVTCRTAAACAADDAVVDMVGYGAAAVHETAPAPAGSNTLSVARDGELTDTDDNSADFTAGDPTPVNAAGETGPGDGGGGAPGPEQPGELRIHDIQGTTRVSPHSGQEVAGVPGVVTAVNPTGSARGFWFQDAEGDDDPRTSEALFVFTGSTTPDVAVGDEVLVTGRVAEYRPGDADMNHQSITQLTGAVWTVLSSGNDVPEAVELEPDTVPDAYAPDAGGDISGLGLRPDDYALDFWAAHEHMVVRVEDARVVGATDGYNALWVTTKPEQNASPRGGTVYGSYADANSGRLKIESLIPFAERPFPEADVGDELRGVTEGPLYYSQFGGYLLKATTLGEHVANGLERETTSRARDWELSVATYNVENLSPADDQSKFDRLAEGIVQNLRSPDIVNLEEIQDNSGPVNDGVVDADETLERLIAAIKDAGGPTYHWRQISPENNRDGGAPGGNIRNAFLFNPARTTFVDVPGGDATTGVEVTTENRRVGLSASPGRIAPQDAAWESSRKPLVGQFRFQGRDVFVVTNHFNSKGGDQPLYGTVQPPNRSSEQQRHAQAALVRDFVDELIAADPDANVLVVGDLNDFQFSRTLETLTADGGLYNPMTDLPAEERYNYLYDGNAQSLDHMLVSPRVEHRVRYDIVHVNAEFHDQTSDHDPQVLRFRPLSGDHKLDRREDNRYYRGNGHR